MTLRKVLRRPIPASLSSSKKFGWKRTAIGNRTFLTSEHSPTNNAVLVPKLRAGFLITGLVLGVSAAGYWILSLLALVGAVLAGFEHRDGWEAADRGLLGGALFGTALLVAHALAGTHAQVSLPKFAPMLAVFTAIVGMLASALGGRLRRTASGRATGSASAES